MNDVVIIQDHAGYSERVRALQSVHPRVFPVTPWDKPNRHCTSFRPPENWLPADSSAGYPRRCWWKADAMGLAAVQALQIDADFYWFVESDAIASQDRWRAIFGDWRDDGADLVAPLLRSRLERPRAAVWSLPSTPDWTTHYILMAVFRLSRRALVECTRCAVEMREVFSEVAIPSVVHRAGFVLAGLNQRETHCNGQTFGSCPTCIQVNPKLLNHPVKRDSFAP